MVENIDKDGKILAEFQQFAKQSNAYLKDRLDRINDDMKVNSGDIFNDEDQKRIKDLVKVDINYLRPYTLRISNQYREKPFGICVNSQEGNTKTGEFLQRFIRGIERKSCAKQAHLSTLDTLVPAGIGYFGITTDYTDSVGFDQEVKFFSIPRADMVIDDPFDESINGGDATKRALVNHVPKDTVIEEYGEDVIDQYDKSNTACDSTRWQAPEDSICIVTYYRIRKETSKVYLDETGESVEENALRSNAKIKATAKNRTTTKTSVDVYKIVGKKVVSKTNLPIPYIPICRSVGSKIIRNNKTDFVGLAYPAKPIIRTANLAMVEALTRLSKAPRSLFTVDGKSVANYNEIISSDLPIKYFPYDSRDQQNPDIQYNKPELLQATVDISDMIGLVQRCKEDLSSVLGMSEAGLLAGQKSNQTAAEVLTKQKSQDISNYQILDNFSETLILAGKIVLSLLPHIYDTRRMIPMENNGSLAMIEENVSEMAINPDVYGINVDSGPMSATDKREQLNMTLAICEAMSPEEKSRALPKIIRLSEIEGAEEFARIYDTGAQNPQADALAQQADQTISALTQQVNDLTASMDQYKLYIQQLQAENGQIKADNSAIIYKANLDYAKALQVEAMKQQGNLDEKRLEILSKSMDDLEKARAEYERIANSQPEFKAVVGATPKLNSVGRQQNDLETV